MNFKNNFMSRWTTKRCRTTTSWPTWRGSWAGTTCSTPTRSWRSSRRLTSSRTERENWSLAVLCYAATRFRVSIYPLVTSLKRINVRYWPRRSNSNNLISKKNEFFWDLAMISFSGTNGLNLNELHVISNTIYVCTWLAWPFLGSKICPSILINHFCWSRQYSLNSELNYFWLRLRLLRSDSN